MEGIFKFTFVLAILLFCLLVVGVFLLIMKIVLMFNTEVNLMGLIITYP